MHKGRMEAFTDGVIAVIITIMVLELKLPHEATWHALLSDPRVPELCAQFRLRRHLLEQSPPHAAIGHARQRSCVVGQPVLPVLAVAVSVHDKLVERIASGPGAGAYRSLLNRAAVGGTLVGALAACADRGEWRRKKRAWRSAQG